MKSAEATCRTCRCCFAGVQEGGAPICPTLSEDKSMQADHTRVVRDPVFLFKETARIFIMFESTVYCTL